MTPAAFVAKWKANTLSERAGAQSYFLDLCDVLGVEKPSDAESYCFERGATKTGSGNGWADVWKRNCFAWENKGPHGDLGKALRQLMTYALALENPPLLVVCDRETIEIHTHFTGTPSEVHVIHLDDIGQTETQEKLRWVFNDPERFRPNRSINDITADAAGHFAEIARALTDRGNEPHAVAHFLIQCLFCMFAEDVRLLPRGLFVRVAELGAANVDKLGARLAKLFTAMRTGGDFGAEDIAFFNGGLFEKVEALQLTANDAKVLLAAARMDWSNIEPTIFGTLFERGLDPGMRAQLGAQYTDPATIWKIIEPAIVRPLAAEWMAQRESIARDMAKYVAGGRGATAAHRAAQATFLGFLGRLKRFRVLDPACGSGNFLYLALRALKDLEHRANLDAEALGLQRQIGIECDPSNVLGIEINEYAAELARVTVWIGEIQWMLKHGYDIRRNPILSPLDHIERRDAILNEDGSDASWPRADVIVGNPPFLGTKKQWGKLGRSYVDRLRAAYAGRVPGFADLVLYWFEKARASMIDGGATRAGLVGTNSIRGGANRKVLDRICETTTIFDAWADEAWVNDGAAVRVSLVCFGAANETRLNGVLCDRINPDLTSGVTVTQATPLAENSDCCFVATVKSGPFDLDGNSARALLAMPNPHGRANSDVVRPWANGRDFTGRPTDTWIIDFGVDMSEQDAMLYEAPFARVRTLVLSQRDASSAETKYKRWWLMARPIPAMRKALVGKQRYIATPVSGKHRLFVWVDNHVLPDHQLVVFAREDEVTFGILHSRMHEVWSLGLCTWLGVGNDPRYTPTTTFETFPFPLGMTPRDTAHGAPAGNAAMAIAAGARRLHSLREGWLNPREWVDVIPEVLPGFPNRNVAKPGHEQDLRKRTLTKLYNERPAWLESAHRALDVAVASAYGWTDYTMDMPDEEILRRLLELNRERGEASH